MALKLPSSNENTDNTDYESLYYALFGALSDIGYHVAMALQTAEERYLHDTDSKSSGKKSAISMRFKDRPMGVHRGVDRLGRVVIPKEMRNILDIDHNDSMEITMEGKRIYLQKRVSCCVVCDCEDGLQQHDGKHLCKSCYGKLVQ